MSSRLLCSLRLTSFPKNQWTTVTAEAKRMEFPIDCIGSQSLCYICCLTSIGVTWTVCALCFVIRCVSVYLCLCMCVSVVSNVSELLGLDSFQLSEVLTQRSMILRGEEICSPLTVEQVTTNPLLIKESHSSHRAILLSHPSITQISS